MINRVYRDKLCLSSDKPVFIGAKHCFFAINLCLSSDKQSFIAKKQCLSESKKQCLSVEKPSAINIVFSELSGKWCAIDVRDHFPFFGGGGGKQFFCPNFVSFTESRMSFGQCIFFAHIRGGGGWGLFGSGEYSSSEVIVNRKPRRGRVVGGGYPPSTVGDFF